MKQNLLVVIISLMIGLSSYKGICQDFATESYTGLIRADEDNTEESYKVASYFKLSEKIGEIKIFFPEPVTTYFEIEVVKEFDDYYYIKGINSHAISIELIYDKKDYSLAIVVEGSKSVYILVK